MLIFALFNVSTIVLRVRAVENAIFIFKVIISSPRLIVIVVVLLIPQVFMVGLSGLLLVVFEALPSLLLIVVRGLLWISITLIVLVAFDMSTAPSVSYVSIIVILPIAIIVHVAFLIASLFVASHIAVIVLSLLIISHSVIGTPHPLILRGAASVVRHGWSVSSQWLLGLLVILIARAAHGVLLLRTVIVVIPLISHVGTISTILIGRLLVTLIVVDVTAALLHSSSIRIVEVIVWLSLVVPSVMVVVMISVVVHHVAIVIIIIVVVMWTTITTVFFLKRLLWSTATQPIGLIANCWWRIVTLVIWLQLLGPILIVLVAVVVVFVVTFWMIARISWTTRSSCCGSRRIISRKIIVLLLNLIELIMRPLCLRIGISSALIRL